MASTTHHRITQLHHIIQAQRVQNENTPQKQVLFSLIRNQYPLLQQLSLWNFMKQSIESVFFEAQWAKYGTEDLKNFCQHHAVVFCYPLETSKQLPLITEQSFETPDWNQHELVRQIIQDLCVTKTHNVLCYGYRLAKPDHSTLLNSHLSNFYPNTIVNYMSQQNPWGILYKCMGQSFMVHILMNAIVLVALPNNGCFLQVTGIPLYVLLKKQFSSSKKRKFEVFQKEQQIASKIAKHVIGGFVPRYNGSMDSPFMKKQQQQMKDCFTVPNISRYSIFYHNTFFHSNVLQHGFHKSNVWNSVQYNMEEKSVSTNQLKKLIIKIFPFLKIDTNNRLSMQRYGACIQVLRQIKENQIKFGDNFYYMLVNCYCKSKTKHVYAPFDKAGHSMKLHQHTQYVPQPDLETKIYFSLSSFVQALIADYCSYSDVASWLQQCCKILIPDEFFGEENNRRIFNTWIAKFVAMGRYETSIPIHKVMEGMKMNSMYWLVAVSSTMHTKQIFLEAMLYFLFESIVIPLLQYHFYVTESSIYRTKIFYYKKSTWFELMEVSDWKTIFEEVSVELKLANNSISKMRLLPKTSNLRPIVNMSSNLSTNRNQNQFLKNLLHILKFENEKFMQTVQNEYWRQHPTLGSSVFNPVQIYRRLLPFISAWKQSTNSTPLPLFFCSVDVKGAYDSIPHKKLLEILFNETDPILQEEEYTIVRYNLIRPYLGKVISQLHQRYVMLPRDFSQFKDLATNVLSKMHSKSILIDQVVYAFEERENLEKLLREHVTNNLITMNGKLYRQKKGIPQGSILSPLLCSYVYGNLEKNHLQHLISKSLSMNPIPFSNSTASSSAAISRLLDSPQSSSSSMAACTLQTPKRVQHSVMQSPILFASPPLLLSDSSSVGGKIVKSPVFSPPTSPPKRLVQRKLFNEEQSNNYSSPQEEGPLRSSNEASSISSSVSIEEFNSILLRLIDDFMFVSTDQQRVIEFARKMTQGFDEYGARINRKKTKLNFDLTIGDVVTSFSAESQTITSYEGQRYIKWCGFVFDSVTFETRNDYSKYWEEKLIDTISKDAKEPGIHLARKLKQSISWKCNPLVIDGTINSIFTICVNIYQIFLFVAMKFHCLVQYSLQKSMKQNHIFLLTTVGDCISYMWVTICARAELIHKLNSFSTITEQKVYYLGLHAFLTVLLRKQEEKQNASQSMSRVISMLKQKLSMDGTTISWLSVADMNRLTLDSRKLLENVVKSEHHEAVLRISY